MFTQNSNRDLFSSQTWSQIDSQDWPTQISSSQENVHRVPSTPSSHVLPPTPSSSSLQNSWGRRMPPVPQSVGGVSQPNMPPRFVAARETTFSKEIRFALHAVLSVVKELPDKLQEILGKSSDLKENSDDQLFDKIKKIVEEKMSQVEKLIANVEMGEAVVADTKKFHDLLHSGMIELNKNLTTHDAEMSNFSGSLKAKTEILKKQICRLRKLYINESNKLQTMLSDLKRNSTAQETDLKLERCINDIESATKESKKLNQNILCCLQEKSGQEMELLNSVLTELQNIKSSLKFIPTEVGSSMRNALYEISQNIYSGKPNVRIASRPSQSPLVRRRNVYSPVARIIPQVKEVPTNATTPKVVPVSQACHSSAMKRNTVLDVIEPPMEAKRMEYAIQEGHTETSTDISRLMYRYPEKIFCSIPYPELLNSIPVKKQRISHSLCEVEDPDCRNNVIFSRPVRRHRVA